MEIRNVAKKIPNTSALAKKTDGNTKITDIKNKIPSATGLLTTSVLSTKS